MFHEIVPYLKLAGAACSSLGAILLAWRVRSILKWVVNALVTHEHSLEQHRLLLSGKPQTEPTVSGVTKHLLNIQNGIGLFLLIAGFALLGIGMASNALVYFDALLR
jgi:hypothetical protein